MQCVLWISFHRTPKTRELTSIVKLKSESHLQILEVRKIPSLDYMRPTQTRPSFVGSQCSETFVNHILVLYFEYVWYLNFHVARLYIFLNIHFVNLPCQVRLLPEEIFVNISVHNLGNVLPDELNGHHLQSWCVV